MNSDTSDRKLLTRGSIRDWSPDGDRFYYNSGYSSFLLCSYDKYGENPMILSTIHSGYCSFSPLGDKILFSHDQDIHGGFTVFNFPEFEEPLHMDQDGAFPSYSHSGEEIVFCYNDPETDGYGTVYIMSSDGSNSRKIVEESTDYQYYYPRWSPDDDKIIFLSSDYNMENWYLWMVDKDGSNLHKVLNDNTVTSCDWSQEL
jgi:Tol biopolymer transport system component